MLNISQPVAVLPLAAQGIIDDFSRAEAAIVAAQTLGQASRPAGDTPDSVFGAYCVGSLSRSAAKGERADAEPYYFDEPHRAAVIPISGTIIAKKTPCMKSFPELFSVAACDEIQAAVRAALADDRVEAIVFDIDSPGGTVTGTPETAGTILAARERKPCIAFSSGLMCSAAYWIAAQCDAVFASPSATVGSIGVFMAFLDTSRKLANEGYRVELFSTGVYKGAGVTGSLTDAQRAHFQSQVEDIFEEFKAAVSPRGIPAEAMQGQTFFGRGAADARLIDGFALSPAQALRKRAEKLNSLRVYSPACGGREGQSFSAASAAE